MIELLLNSCSTILNQKNLLNDSEHGGPIQIDYEGMGGTTKINKYLLSNFPLPCM